MSKRFGDHLRSNVVGYVAVFIALGGAAYAANTIGSKDIVNGQVKTKDVGDNQIRSVDVRDDSLANGGLTGADLGPDSVTGSELAPDSVAGSELAPDSVGASELLTDSVTESELAPNSVDAAALLDGSVGSATVADESLGGVDIDESTLGIVPEAATVDGAELCRTDAPVSVSLNSQAVLCGLGSLSLVGTCFEPGVTPPFTPTARLRVDSSLDDAFAFGDGGGDADLDAADAPAQVLSATPPGAGANSRGGATSAIGAGGTDGSQLAGTAAILAVVGSGPSTPDGHCEFVVGATG